MTVFDIHTHGIGGVDTRTTDPADILKMADIHGSHGVDAILATIYPAPLESMRANMAAVREAMERQQGKNAPERGRIEEPERRKKEVAGRGEEEGRRTAETESGRGGESKKRREKSREFGVRSNEPQILITRTSTLSGTRPARIVGVYLEGPFLNPLRAGALDGASFLAPSSYALDRLLDGFEDIVSVVVVAPELPGALSLIRSLADRGIRVSMGHSDATFAEAEAGFRAGASGVTHLFNAMRPWHHREPGLAGFGLTHPEIYVEVIADPYHLHESALKLLVAAKNPERILLVSDSVRETRTTQGGGAVRDKRGSLAGGSMSLPEAADRLLRLGFNADLIVQAVAGSQERYLGTVFPISP
jgi:N-acetylglucosamine-6-phosphate deacetylase